MENFKPAIRYGLIMSFIGIVIFLLVWALAPDMFGTFSWMITQGVLIMIAMPIVFQILGTRDSKENFEFFTYGNAFKAAFLVGLAAIVLSLLFNLVFHFLIDPEFNTRLKESVMDMTLERLEDANVDQEVIDEHMDKIAGRFDSQAGFVGQLKTSFYGLVWYSILAAIIAIVYKDKAPKEEM